MTKRLRFNDKCPIGNDCSKVERARDGWLAVTGYLPDRSEATVEVEDDLIPGIAEMEVHDLGDYLDQRHKTDLLRVQTLGSYGAATDGNDFHRYLSGAAYPESPARDEWFAQLRAEAAAGRIRRNLHIVREPITPYLRYAMEWGYVYNIAAGQECRILTVGDTTAAAHLFKVGDFNVVEGLAVVRLRYDDNGTRIGAVKVSADAAESYAALAELAWGLGTDFTVWWEQHPQYHRATPAA